MTGPRSLHRRLPVLLASPYLRVSTSPPPVLLDNFTGTDALTSHTPDIAPAGASWANVGSATYGNLSGGYLPHASGTSGRAVIDSGLADCEFRFRFKFLNLATNGIGVALRSNNLGTDYYYMSTAVDSGNYIAMWNIPNSFFLDPPNQPTAQKCIKPLVFNNYYTWTLILKGAVARLYDGSGVLTLAAAGIAKLTNTYFGVFNHQAGGSWDFIEVKPISKRFITLSAIGDSISDGYGEWPGITAAHHNNGYCLANQHAAAGASIQSNLDDYIDAAELANSDFTIILLGTNDGHSYDPTAKVQENLVELFGTLGKPIYCCGILPTTTWTEAERNTFNGRIQTAVANAQAAGVNATYWNTDGWIDPTDPADTADGLHPTAAGHIKVANEIILKL